MDRGGLTAGRSSVADVESEGLDGVELTSISVEVVLFWVAPKWVFTGISSLAPVESVESAPDVKGSPVSFRGAVVVAASAVVLPCALSVLAEGRLGWGVIASEPSEVGLAVTAVWPLISSEAAGVVGLAGVGTVVDCSASAGGGVDGGGVDGGGVDGGGVDGGGVDSGVDGGREGGVDGGVDGGMEGGVEGRVEGGGVIFGEDSSAGRFKHQTGRYVHIFVIDSTLVDPLLCSVSVLITLRELNTIDTPIYCTAGSRVLLYREIENSILTDHTQRTKHNRHTHILHSRF